MVKPIFIDVRPFVTDYYAKTTKVLFDEVGGNTGNLAFMYSAVNLLAQAGTFRYLGDAPDTVRASGDVIVLALANQLGSHTDLSVAADRLEAFGLPIVGVGLGAQANSLDDKVALKDGTARWLDVISRSTRNKPNLGVRGQYSLQTVQSLGYEESAVVTGCPSLFINRRPDLGEQVSARLRKKVRRIAVCAGIPYIPSLEKIEQNLADIVTLTDGAYIVQHGLQMIQLARNGFDDMDPATLEICNRYIQPHKSREEFVSWCRRFAYAFFDVRSWMEFYRRFDFVVGTRFHGAMLAIQAGIPAGCIAHDSRTLEMCQTMHVPVVKSSDIAGALTTYNILDYFAFDPNAFEETRTNLACTYCSLFRSSGLEVTSSLAKLAAMA